MRRVFSYYKNLPKYEYRQFRSEISWAEYALWWGVRIAMIYALYNYVKDPGTAFINRLMLLGNFTATFTVFLGRLIFTKFIFLGRLPYSMQRYITIVVLAGSFFGHYIGCYSKITNYDKWLHILVGFVGVFIGYHVMMCMKHDRRPVPPFIAAFAGFGFSCFISVAWEVFEFFADYYIAGSCNQNYGWTPNPDMLFFKIFGLGVQNAGQTAVFDTMFDMMLGLLGAIISGILMWPYVKYDTKKMTKKPSPDQLRWKRAPVLESGSGSLPECETEREPVAV